MKDYYTILGVEPSATAAEIKQAYNRLAQTHHPDKGGNADTFIKVTNAYNAIKDQKPIPTKYSARPMPLRIKLDISLRDAMLGGTKMVSITGRSGNFDVAIQIVPGLGHNAVLRYPDLGPNNEDVYVEFCVLPNPLFSRDGDNIILVKQVLVWDLLLGTVITLPSIDERTFSFAIPEGTQPGTTFRMRGLGVKNQGDMLVRVECVLPKTMSTPLKTAIMAEITKETHDSES